MDNLSNPEHNMSLAHVVHNIATENKAINGIAFNNINQSVNIRNFIIATYFVQFVQHFADISCFS